MCIKLNAQSEERKGFVFCRNNELVVCLQRGAHLCRCRSGWERIFVAFVYRYVAIYLRWLLGIEFVARSSHRMTMGGQCQSSRMHARACLCWIAMMAHLSHIA